LLFLADIRGEPSTSTIRMARNQSADLLDREHHAFQRGTARADPMVSGGTPFHHRRYLLLPQRLQGVQLSFGVTMNNFRASNRPRLLLSQPNLFLQLSSNLPGVPSLSQTIRQHAAHLTTHLGGHALQLLK